MYMLVLGASTTRCFNFVLVLGVRCLSRRVRPVDVVVLCLSIRPCVGASAPPRRSPGAHYSILTKNRKNNESLKINQKTIK